MVMIYFGAITVGYLEMFNDIFANMLIIEAPFESYNPLRWLLGIVSLFAILQLSNYQ